MVNYLHKFLVEIPTVHTLSVASVIAPIRASSIVSVHLSDDEHQEIPAKLPGTNYREKYPVEITVKIPDDVTLTLCNTKFLEKTTGNLDGGISS